MDEPIANEAGLIELPSGRAHVDGEKDPTENPGLVPEVLRAYSPREDVFDECRSASHGVRKDYAGFFDALPGLTEEELKRRGEVARRIIQEQGITYNVYGDASGMERPWQQDPMPLILGAAEWRKLEQGLIQRATLLNRVLTDCYGPQDLIRTAWLPPALVFGQPDFLRPCHGTRTADDTFLHFYAADLARSADGQWWVISDRTQIPTGAGYALANRLVSARILSEPFRSCRVQRLAGFFRDVQKTLGRLGSRRSDQPRVVVHTPGPFNETYFEQAWLARYLGYPLVEGQDLTVRDDRVFLKTLSGLEPVDVILRRVDDDWCDPLELRNDSMLGIPGLVRALRAGTVAVANSLGSGLVQSPAFMAFLPGLCRHLHGEDLRLPSIATWWCGQREANRYVSEHLDDLVVKPAFRSPNGEQPAMLSAEPEGRRELEARIAFRPELFVAQERITFSTVPTWNGEALVPRPALLRMYLAASPEGYVVMPGGLTRVGGNPDSGSLSLRQGGTSKDTWVLTDGPIEVVSLLGEDQRVNELRRVGNNLPSRLADNFFWLGRYAERADGGARLLRSLLLRLSPESTGSALSLVEPLLDTLTRQGQLAAPGPGGGGHSGSEAIEKALLDAIFDSTRRGSLRAIAGELQRLAVLVRDRTSNDLWRVLTQLGELLAPSNRSTTLQLADSAGLLNQTLLHLAALHGLARENMTRAQGWRFLDMGLRIERAIYLCNFLDAALHSPEADNPSILETVLEVADSTLTYRSRYNLLPNIAAVYDLVLLDDTNPRSLLFQFNQLVKHFERLPREKESALPSPAHRLLLEGLTRVRLVDPRSLLNRDCDWHLSGVGTVVGLALKDLPKLSEAIAVSYFEHSAISRTGRP